jgi:glycosyltransferase involved in cell wall biosynthesis
VKILIASFTFPPNKDGVSEAASVMAAGFLNHGWNVEVATLATDPPRESDSWKGASIREFQFEGAHNAPGETSRRREQWGSYLKKGDWDVIIIHAYVWQFHFSLPYLADTKGRKVLVSHGYAALQWAKNSKFPFGLPSLLLNSTRSVLMPLWQRRFDRVVFLSQKVDFMGFYDHWLAKYGGYHGRRVIPNGVDLKLRGEDPDGFRVRNGIGRGTFMLLCVANYSPRKDQGYAARAYRRAGISDSVLVFIGSEFNEYSKRFQKEDARFCGDAAKGRIIWLEKLEREETLNAIAACDAFVLSANHEAQPISLLEAMRESKPWVAREAGCIDEMPGGLCVKTEQAMAEAMGRMEEDKDLRASLSASGRLAVETTYNLDCYTNSYCQLVEELVSSGP